MSRACLLALATAAAVASTVSLHPAGASSLLSDTTKMNRQWVAICPSAWSSSVAPLRDFRASQGRRACIWTLDDITQTYGGAGATQIRQALSDAYNNWTVKPRWIVLVGDHDAAGGANNIIQDWRLYKPELAIGSDYVPGLWPYQDLDDDNVPELAVGRVPASNSSDVGNYVAKVIEHDNAVNAGDAASLAAAMLVEDHNINGNDSLWVRHLGDSLYTNWMSAASKQIIYYSTQPSLAAAKQAVVTAWNTGPGMVAALGNGSNWFLLTNFWDECTPYYWWWSIDALSGSHRYPMLLGLSCALNATDHPVASSCDTQRPLSEQLLLARSDRGACGVVGPTRTTYQYWDFLIGKYLLLRKAAGDFTWGEVFENAMADALNEDAGAYDHVYQYVFEGDPAAQANRGEVVGVEGHQRMTTVLERPTPNPAAQRAVVRYSLERTCDVELGVYDIAGRMVRHLGSRREPAGAYVVSWDLRDDSGLPVRPAAFFVRLRADGRSMARQLVVVR